MVSNQSSSLLQLDLQYWLLNMFLFPFVLTWWCDNVNQRQHCTLFVERYIYFVNLYKKKKKQGSPSALGDSNRSWLSCLGILVLLFRETCDSGYFRNACFALNLISLFILWRWYLQILLLSKSLQKLSYILNSSWKYIT